MTIKFQFNKSLEWCTELPLKDCPRKSPLFLANGNEWFFKFVLEKPTQTWYFNLYMEFKCTHTEFKPCQGNLQVGFLEEQNLSLGNQAFIVSEPRKKEIWYISMKKLQPKLLSDYLDCKGIKFIFSFGDIDESLLKIYKEVGEKSTQADMMLSLQTDVEYLSLDFGELLRNGDHSDVQLLCKGGNIPAHRAILAARSKTFSDMFRDNTEECKSGLINMTTTEKSVIELCLEFIYKGKILNLPVEMASNLYVLGHVLNISSLTKVCADLMIHNLCEDNYISYLILVDKYDDDYFKRGVIDFISNHVKLLKSENWMKFSGEHMKTAFDVQRKCLLKFI